MSPRTLQITWLFGILIWVLICSAGWVVATRDDYAKLTAATACYRSKVAMPILVPQCENVKESDILTYKAAIDRKAAISRIVVGLGAGAALALWFLLGRPGLHVRPVTGSS